MSYVNTCGKCRGLGFAICHCNSGGTASASICYRCWKPVRAGVLHVCTACPPLTEIHRESLPFADEEPAPEPWICPVCRCGVRGDVERCPCRATERGGPLGIWAGPTDTDHHPYLHYTSGTTSGGGGAESDPGDEDDEGEEAP
jgi:hypothetical protein